MDSKEKNIATEQATESAKLNLVDDCCPLCDSKETSIIHRDSHSKIDRDYLQCSLCDLIYVPRQYHLDSESEKAVYDCHENNPSAPGYRQFLSKLVQPLLKHLSHGATGLDFGCGPGPTLSVMLREHGYSVAEYDPFYHPDTSALGTTYDFVTTTEVVEHLSNPKAVFQQLFGLLNNGGVLGIMTKRPPQQGIVGWHYTKDPTHVTFYSLETFNYIAKQYDCSLEVVTSDTVILIKNN